MTPYTYSM